jgi:hypothetical protein
MLAPTTQLCDGCGGPARDGSMNDASMPVTAEASEHSNKEPRPFREGHLSSSSSSSSLVVVVVVLIPSSSSAEGPQQQAKAFARQSQPAE